MTQGLYKMGTISRMTGLSPILLRAWERRYALIAPQRGPGGQRLYTAEDLDVLRRAQELLKSGRSIGEVAALGREALLVAPVEKAVRLSVSGQNKVSAASDGFLETLRGNLLHAAMTLDSDGLNRTLDEAAAALSFPALIEKIIEPAAREIGDLWRAGRCTVASEHLVTSIFVHRVRRIMDSIEWGRDSGSDTVVAACIPGEQHELGLLVIGYFLSCRGIRVVFLGANLPLADLRRACAVRRPRAVLLSVSLRETFQRERLALKELLRSAGSGTYFYVGGSGAPAKDPELEAAGLRLSSLAGSAQEKAERIAADFGRNARKPGLRRKSRARRQQ